jgi:hypothetical protein
VVVDVRSPLGQHEGHKDTKARQVGCDEQLKTAVTFDLQYNHRSTMQSAIGNAI